MLKRSELRSLVRMVRDDPVRWCDRVLGVRNWSKIAEVIESAHRNRETAVRSGHGCGKSFGAAEAAITFLCAYENSVVITTAPTARQVNGIIWKYIRELRQKSRIPLGGEMMRSPTWRLGNNWYMYGFSTDTPEAAQGQRGEHTFVVIDEASGFLDPVWDALDGSLSGEHSHLLAIGNPTRTNGRFYEMFKPESRAHKIHISAYDVPDFIPGLVSREWADERKRRWGESSPLYRVRVLGEFPEGEEWTLIPLAWWEAACRREKRPGDNPPRLGLDIANTGSNNSVMYGLRGNVPKCLMDVNGQKTKELAARALEIQREERTGDVLPELRLDPVGVGTGVGDIVEAAGVPFVRCRSKPLARTDRYVNTRSEWHWQLRERFDPDGPDPIAVDESMTDTLGKQLMAIKWSLDDSGRIAVQSKAEMAISPDHADALVMANANVNTGPKPVLLL